MKDCCHILLIDLCSSKYEIPKIENLKHTTFSFDLMCNHLNISKKGYLLRYIRHCRRIAPYLKFYKQQIDYYNWTTYNILQNEIVLCKAVLTLMHNCYLFLYMKCLGGLCYNSLYAL